MLGLGLLQHKWCVEGLYLIFFHLSQGTSLQQKSGLIAGRRGKKAKMCDKTGHVVEDSSVTPQPTIDQDQCQSSHFPHQQHYQQIVYNPSLLQRSHQVGWTEL